MFTNTLFRTEKTNWGLLAATRFFLAMIVMVFHLAYFQTNAFTRFIALFDAGTAVVCFFVVSGFSVASSFDRSSKGFLTRRFLRIYPAYLFATLFALSLQYTLGSYHAHGIVFSTSSPLVIIGNLLLLQKYLFKVLSFNPVYWSLSIEFSYYILLKYFYLIDRKILLFLFFISLIYSIMPRHLVNSHAYELFEKLHMVRCFWPFLVGVALARYPSHAMYLAVAVIGALATMVSDWSPGPLQFVTYLLTIGAIYVAQRGWSFDSIVMERLGDISYPLYLVHVPTGILFAAVLGILNPWAIMAGALAISAFIAFVIETPFRNILKRLGSLRIFHERQLAMAGDAVSAAGNDKPAKIVVESQ